MRYATHIPLTHHTYWLMANYLVIYTRLQKVNYQALGRQVDFVGVLSAIPVYVPALGVEGPNVVFLYRPQYL